MTKFEQFKERFYRLTRYGFSTAVCGAVDLTIFYILSHHLLGDLANSPRLFISTIVARVLSSVLNYGINRKLVFRHHGGVPGSAARYYVLWGALMLSSYFLTDLGASILKLRLPDFFIKLLADVFLGFISYKVQTTWVFYKGKGADSPADYGSFFRFCRALLRAGTKKWETVFLGTASEGAAVYLVNHQYFQGPITLLCWLPRSVRIWALSTFFDLETSRERYAELTFRQKKGWPRALSRLASIPAAAFMKAILTSARAIPVFRGSKDILKTMRESVKSLCAGTSILICPDKDYESRDAKEMYQGYLQLEKYYFRETNRHLRFVPVHLDHKRKRILISQGVFFEEGVPFRVGLGSTAEKINFEFSVLQQQ